MSYRVPICFLLFALALSQISADESEATKEFVLTLDHSNFSDTVTKHDFIVLEFYAPWCGHCKKLAPEYEKAASILSSHDPPIVLAKIDANDEKNKELANQYDVRGYPTIKIVRSGGKNIQEYKGPREADGIVDYLKKQSGPASTEIKSADEASALIGENKVAIVGIFTKFSGEEYENFTALSEKFRSDYDFGHTLDAKHLPRGFGNAVGKFFSSPIEFLSGKSCSSVCGPTWDLVCYIENFCIANLLRLAMVFVLLYGVLLFFYLLHKLGVFGCIGRSICKAMWACCSSCCCICEYACTFFCVKLHKLRKRRRRRRSRQAIDNGLYSSSEEDFSDEGLSNHFAAERNRSFSRRRRDYKGSHLRKSLWPKNDRARVEISRNFSYRNKRHHHGNGDSRVTDDAIKHVNHKGIVHEIKVTRTSKFARKGINNRKIILRR